MAPKRKSLEEIWHLHKRFKAAEAPAMAEVQDNLPGTPPSTEPESSTAQIMREAVEDFKKFAAFEDILAMLGSQYFAEGFYACKNWIGHMIPQLDLSRQCISTILHATFIFLLVSLSRRSMLSRINSGRMRNMPPIVGLQRPTMKRRRRRRPWWWWRIWRWLEVVEGGDVLAGREDKDDDDEEKEEPEYNENEKDEKLKSLFLYSSCILALPLSMSSSSLVFSVNVSIFL